MLALYIMDLIGNKFIILRLSCVFFNPYPANVENKVSS